MFRELHAQFSYAASKRGEEREFEKGSKEDKAMANTINSNYFMQYKNASQIGKRMTAVGKGSGQGAGKAEDVLDKYGASSSVELSGDGLAALANQQRMTVNGAGDGSSGMVKAGDEGKLSAKAQDFLAKLREKYGDYDFIVADNVDDPSELTKGSTKGYSVVLSSEEIEKMAGDEQYADEIMGKVADAVDMADRIAASGELGEGVQFKHIAISFDDQGNTKLFAQLEKMSADQRERLEAAKEKKAEEKEKADKLAEKNKQGEEEEPIRSKQVKLTADSEEDLMQQILGIDWDSIEEQEYPFPRF